MSRATPGRHWGWAVAGMVTLFSYNTWLLWRPLNGHAAIFQGYLSEFSASDQPNNLVFRAGDLLTAVLVAALGLGALARWRRLGRAAADAGEPPPGRWWAVAAAGLLLFALATGLDALSAMDCSPTLDAACRVAEEAGRLSAPHYAHTVTSVTAQAGIVASMTGGYVATRRAPVRWRSGRLARGLILFLLTVELSGLALLLVLLAADLPGLGYPQAVMVLVASLWFVAAGFRLADLSPRTRRAAAA